MAIHPTTGDLSIYEGSLETLWEARAADSFETFVSARGPSVEFVGAAYDPNGRRVFVVASPSTGSPGALGTMDVETGRVTLIGGAGEQLDSLTYDSVRDVLFGVRDQSTLVRVDPATAAQTVIGVIGGSLASVRGLAFDPGTERLFAVDADTDELYTVDRDTAATTLVGSVGAGRLQGLVWDAASGRLSSGRASTSVNMLVAVDPDDATTTDLRSLHTSGGDSEFAAFVLLP